MDFQQAEKSFKPLKAQFEAGTLSEAEYKTRLEELMVQDEQGDWWMIGYETERWHRHDGTNWVQADPPGRLSQLSTPTISSAPRRPYFLISVITVLFFLALSISGYYMLNNSGQKSKQAQTSTQENIFPVSDLPVTGATPTPQPTTVQASKTPDPTSTSQIEFQVSIAVSKATLYNGPGLGYGLAQQTPYQRGETFTVLARDPSGLWLLSRAPDGSEGWLYIGWIEFDFDPMIISIAESIPPLPPAPARKSKDSESGPPCVFNCD
jgi:hypothetical protein